MVVSFGGTKRMFVCHQQNDDKVTTDWKLINSFSYFKYLGKAHTN